ncbi:peptidoglycan-binding protein [Roseateles asaccharophilus]|uniref:Nucleoid-associated protein YgaU n=1 Tax=Roseateles asaccharophilus TaxID=582607 RepID=A0ABU2ABM3_9BURK|nr:peptidoglycan-binding protein [Roseateles asaccharophilus]MDR7334589.1 nucleoid-associated protein YgaU [Roseateles asaccharophilus]
MAGDTPELTRLLLTRYSLAKDRSVKLDKGTEFSAQINPADVSHNFSISYNENKAQGAAYVEPKFSASDNEELSFSITLDGTGVVPLTPGLAPDVKGQLAQLNKVVYEYVDLKCEPPYVRVLWGTLIFFGRMKTMDTQYTLFKPGGDVLRAKIKLTFVGAMSTDKDSKVTLRSSTASTTRTVTVKAGDSLGALCDDVYGDCTAFMKVARYNGLTDFRNIPPGTVLKFPPVEA